MNRLILGYADASESRSKPIYSEEVNIYRRKDTFPRAFIVNKVIFEPDEEKSFAILRKIQLILGGIAVINDKADVNILKLLSKVPAKSTSTAKIVKYTPNEVTVKAYMHTPGLLVLSDMYHPDWKVSLRL